jgi:hypothetical protein
MSIRNQLNAPTPQGLSLQGQQGPNFENETQRTTSEIQALVNNGGILQKSQDLLTGRTVGSFFTPPSNPPVSFPDAFVGVPYYPSLGGTYRNRGPQDGRY